MTNPYERQPSTAFWRKAVADRSPFDISGLWVPKFPIAPEDPVATYGSCFAQHIGRALTEHGFHWLIEESAPTNCEQSLAVQYNYGVFSARTGNIYTSSLLGQWVRWANGSASAPAESWWRDGRCFDPFRPAIEPLGFESEDEMQESRQHAIACFRRSIENARYFVFTLGLTESWTHASGAYEYPMCPGTVAGQFDAGLHRFSNQTFEQVETNLAAALSLIRDLNPSIRVILTVSPVPLTATASSQHVLIATMHSKSILRAVAGQFAERFTWIDYFPSYEMISAPAFGGIFYEPNKRSVNPVGVSFVMKSFFAALGSGAGPRASPGAGAAVRLDESDGSAGEVCEEALLDAFGGRS